jgi:threonine dehydrogenase-like Zn-dependent dehydrogenase
MRAAVLGGAGDVRTLTVGRPEPGPRQVRVRMEGSGVCASSLPVWEGRPWFTYPALPGAPGHEGWGIVDAVGDDADATLLGARVAILSTHAFAEWDVADADALVRVPEALDGHDCPGEALACAVNAFGRGRVGAGDVVAVVGIGFLGAAITALAADAGATVVAFSRRPFARERARDLGAASAHDLDDAAAAARAVAALAPAGLADVVFEAGGVQRTLDLASTLVRTAGRLVIAGFHQDGVRSVDLCLWNWRGLDIVNAHEREPARYVSGMRQAFALVESGVLDLDALVTHHVALGGLGQAFAWVRDRPDGFLKAVVTMG